MNPEFEKYYNQGIEYRDQGNHELSAEAHIKALEFYEDYAEAWHNAGAALLRIQQDDEAIPYLLRALKEYQKRIDEDEDIAYNLFWKSCAYALLEQKEKALQTLRDAIQHNSIYAEEATREEDHMQYFEDEDFKAIIDEGLKELDELRYRGESLSIEDLEPDELEDRDKFVQILKDAGWKIDEIEEYFQEGTAVCPQAMGDYDDNPNYCIRLSYHVDEKLVFMELLNQDNDEIQAYRLYYKKSVQKLTQEIIAFQNDINPDNWMDMIKKLIPKCHEVLYELPNGMKMKLGKL